MFDESRQGLWTGTKALWFDKPEAEESEASLTLEANSLHYTWSFRGEPQSGSLSFKGPNPSLEATWQDSWHSPEKATMHGYFEKGELKLFGTFAGGKDTTWGWKIDLDLRDPRFVQLRMYNVDLEGKVHIAVDLRGAPSK